MLDKMIACAMLVSAMVACGARLPQAATPDPQGKTAAAGRVTASTADVAITQFQDPIQVRVGQTIGLHSPRPNDRWQVSYSDEALQLLTPSDMLQQPGEDGWVWKALVPGETSIMLTSIAACASPPCPPNVMRLTVTLSVVPD